MGERANRWARALAHPNRRVNERHALTLNLDHPKGADQRRPAARQKMALDVEGVVDGGVDRQEALG